SPMKTLELFAGAGGLALGMARSGFKSAGVLEWNSYACETILLNKAAGHPMVADWDVFEADAKTLPFREFEGKADVVSGGPPCQPFSMGGKHRANLDERDMFPQSIRTVREIAPRVHLRKRPRTDPADIQKLL